jgi:hypothetical protein
MPVFRSPPLRLRQVDDCVERAAGHAQCEPCQLIDKQTGEAELVQWAAALGLPGPQVDGESLSTNRSASEKSQLPVPFSPDTCQLS